jgi:RecA-family ATPase
MNAPIKLPLAPNKIDIQKHLAALFPGDFTRNFPDAKIEIAYGYPKPDGAQLFSAHRPEDAVEFAIEKNAEGYNVYVGPTLKKKEARDVKRTGNADFEATCKAWIDEDDVGALETAEKDMMGLGVPGAFLVETGTIPHRRGHVYFLLDEIITNGAELKSINEALAARFRGDPSVTNPGRLLRLAGTVSYPTPDKLVRGYVPELVKIIFAREQRKHAAAKLKALSPSSVPSITSQALATVKPPSLSHDGAPNPFRGVNAAALEHREKWVRALFEERFGAGAVKYHQGSDTYRITSRALGRPNEEDISISRSGIKDFGVHDLDDPMWHLTRKKGGRSAIDLVVEYKACTAADALLWLCKQMGIEPASIGWEAAKDAEPLASFADEAGMPNDGPLPPLPWLNMSNWDNEPMPERKWAIRDRVPQNQAGLFSGEGGTGKSIVELTKNVAHVTGKDWLGSLPEPGPAFYLGAEDEADEIHIRLAAIAKHYGVTFKELVEGGLHVLPLLGQDATLCAPTKSGKVEVTRLYRQLYEAAGDIKPKNISIDTLSRAFSGSEIDRVQVYGFAMHMQALAKVARGSVTVLSHPSLQGINSGSGISGSTAWHGAFRFRQYLKGVAADDGEQPDNDLRQLEFKKNQYGPKGESIVLRYQNGLFLPEGGASSLDKVAREAKAEEVFLDLLRRFTEQGRNVNDKPTTGGYAPRAFAKEAEAKKHGLRVRDMESAMTRLFAANRLRVETYGRPSRPYSRLALAR